ncbi:MAG: purine-nucleoside phosphorylase, partial [Bacteroidales bacterium]
ARHCGIEVFAISVITDLGIEGVVTKCSHEEVQQAAAKAQPFMTKIMKHLISIS